MCLVNSLPMSRVAQGVRLINNLNSYVLHWSHLAAKIELSLSCWMMACLNRDWRPTGAQSLPIWEAYLRGRTKERK